MPLSRLWIVCVSVIATLAACERARPVFVPKAVEVPDTNPIWIGELGSWSGHDAREGLAEHRGFQLAIEAANGAGGVRGRRVRVHGYDDQSVEHSAGEAGRRLALQDKAVLIVGGTTTARASVAAQAAGEVPLITPGFVPRETGEHAWFAVGIEPDPALYVERLVDYARTSGFQRVTTLARPEVESDGMYAAAFASRAKDRGLERVDERAITLEGLDATIAALKADAPPAIFVACSGLDAAGVCNVLRRRGITSVLLAAGAPDIESLPADQRDTLEGIVAASVFDPDARSGPAADLIALHDKRFDGARSREEAPDEHELLGWLAGRRAIAVLTLAHEYWPRDVKSAVIATNDPPPSFVIVRIQHGELHTVKAGKSDT